MYIHVETLFYLATDSSMVLIRKSLVNDIDWTHAFYEALSKLVVILQNAYGNTFPFMEIDAVWMMWKCIAKYKHDILYLFCMTHMANGTAEY